MFLEALHAALTKTLNIERRLEPWFRPAFDRILRDPSAKILQALINMQRKDEGLGLAEEKPLPGEERALQDIIDAMAAQMRNHFKPGHFERGGNTKTHGIVRGTITIRNDIPSHMRRGLFAEPKTYKAWLRYSGPGPALPNDIDDVGFGSMTIKIMGVPGPKLMEDEKYTQDFLTVCTPTFVTPNIVENAKLQRWSLRELPIFYFLNPKDTHILDFLMQSLWNATQYNPLGQYYYSCVPYLLGEGQAMQYSFYPKTEVPKDIPGLPWTAPPNYLRDNMVKTLAEKDVAFEMRAQVQTDPHRMPIENAAVLWPEKLSPRVPVADIHIPKQTFDSPEQFAFGRVLSINPWHCLPDHRPLGNQSRARQRMYQQLSQFRQQMNASPHIEPTGDEVFD